VNFELIVGGALKPTNVDNLWVHVTCAWFQPQVAFADELMEPAIGILNIQPLLFMKVVYLSYYNLCCLSGLTDKYYIFCAEV